MDFDAVKQMLKPILRNVLEESLRVRYGKFLTEAAVTVEEVELPALVNS